MKLNRNFLSWGDGVQTKKPSMGGGGGVWIFSGTAYGVFLISKLMNNL